MLSLNLIEAINDACLTMNLARDTSPVCLHQFYFHEICIFIFMPFGVLLCRLQRAMTLNLWSMALVSFCVAALKSLTVLLRISHFHDVWHSQLAAPDYLLD